MDVVGHHDVTHDPDALLPAPTVEVRQDDLLAAVAAQELKLSIAGKGDELKMAFEIEDRAWRSSGGQAAILRRAYQETTWHFRIAIGFHEVAIACGAPITALWGPPA
ncbi:MAG: hypothetical protein M5U26_12040 [Planctomycetota bacterium]|nr:hypothetical protein [Planctomycetota bacterium]